jgi:hypothetical protein
MKNPQLLEEDTMKPDANAVGRDESEINMLKARLEKLEKQNRRRWSTVLGILGIAGAAILMNQAVAKSLEQPKSSVVEATKFVLKDENGKIRAILGSTPPNEIASKDRYFGLRLYDQNGKLMTTLSAEKGTSNIVIESDGIIRTMLDTGGLRYYDEKDNLRCSIQGKGGLRLWADGKDGEPLVRAELAVVDNKGLLVLWDENSKMVFSKP